jgi:ankyrin repeat protein
MSAVVIGFVIVLVAGTNIVEADDKDLFQAAASGDIRMVRFFLEIGADVNAKNKDGKTALMLASDKGNLEAVKLLLDKGAEVNAKNKDGKTALLVASNLEVAKLLLDKGGDVNVKDKNGATALREASWRSDNEMVNLLKAYGAK